MFVRFPRRLALFVLAALLLAGVPAAAAQAADPQPEHALIRLFTSPHLDDRWLAPDFAADIYAPRGLVATRDDLAAAIRTYLDAFGALRDVEADGEALVVVLERATVRMSVTLDQEGRITLVTGDPPVPDGFAAVDRSLDQLDGEASMLVTEDRRDIYARAPEVPRGVGSAFKMAVLKAYLDRIAAGGASWSDVVEMRPQWRIPGSQMATWLDGSRITTETLATLMISLSDNTATDALISLLGREAVEALSPRNTPLLSTRDLFLLKRKGNEGELERWRKGDVAARRALLAELDTREVDWSTYELGELAPDVEWFFTARELCALVAEVGEARAMQANPGAARAQDWETVAYKGGSEAMLVSVTHHLRHADGRAFCVTGAWNEDEPIDHERFILIAAGAIQLLR